MLNEPWQLLQHDVDNSRLSRTEGLIGSVAMHTKPNRAIRRTELDVAVDVVIEASKPRKLVEVLPSIPSTVRNKLTSQAGDRTRTKEARNRNRILLGTVTIVVAGFGIGECVGCTFVGNSAGGGGAGAGGSYSNCRFLGNNALNDGNGGAMVSNGGGRCQL